MLRRFEVLSRCSSDELGIGPSPEAYELRVRRSTPRSAPTVGRRRTAVRAAAPGPPARQLLPDHGRGAAGVRDQRHGAAAGEGVELADPSRPRLGAARSGGTGGRRCRRTARWSATTSAAAGCPTGTSTPRPSPSTPGCADLETVVDTLGLERFPLLGMSQGGPIAVTYAARHPERVSHLVVYGTCARATWARAAPTTSGGELAALGELIKTSWGSDQPGFRQVYDARFLPDGPLETVARVRRAAAPDRPRRETRTGCGGRSGRSTRRGRPRTRRADADPALPRRPGLVVRGSRRSCMR